MKRDVEREVVFVQPALAAYRLPFYRSLEPKLLEQGLGLRVLVGTPDRERARRRDLSTLEMAEPIRTYELMRKPVRLAYKHVTLERSIALLVLEHGSTVLENYPLILRRRRYPVALWGHGGAFVSKGGLLDANLERWQLRRGAHYFAYTEAGANAVIEQGMRASCVTAVRNSTDVAGLRMAPSGRRHPIDEMPDLLDLKQKRVGLFVGGLDGSKRIGFLLDAVRVIQRSIPEFVILVCGDGAERPLVESMAAENSGIRYIGRVERSELARVAAMSELILMPGRVGLVAVDSFALGVPIVTTNWQFHAPEFEYLRAGEDCVVTADSLADYAQGVISLLQDDDLRRVMAEACWKRADDFGIEGMAARFAAGIAHTLAAREAGH